MMVMMSVHRARWMGPEVMYRKIWILWVFEASYEDGESSVLYSLAYTTAIMLDL